MRKRWRDVALEGAFVLGVLAGLGYVAALLTYALVIRWMGGGL